MPPPNPNRMARPRSGRTKKSKRGPSSSSEISSSALRVLSRLWAWLSGPVGQQFLALVVMGFGILSLVTLARPNWQSESLPESGILLKAWTRFLVFVFGWGAYPMAALITALGLLWLRHLVHQPTGWRWRPIFGLEITLISLLTLTHTFLSQYGWQLVESGQGGGVLGWALYVFFSDYFGPLITGFLMAGVMLLGIGLAFDLTGEDLRIFGQRIVELGLAIRAQREAAKKTTPAVDSPGTATSPIPQHAKSAPTAATEPESAPPPVKLPSKARSTPTRSATAQSAAPSPPRDRSKDLPPLKLLKKRRAAGIDAEETRRKSRIIEETLAQFGVPARVTEVRPGPTVTQFGVSPGYISRGADGEEQRKVRVSQIATLADDLALALAAKSLRVEAPVPGRAVVGIEVPNADISLVSLRNVLESENFQKCGKPLCFAVGMDVAGTCVVADLSTMPHLLVAGTTGSGKSVFVKALAASLVMHNSPQALRLVTIDPKMVELSHLNGLPHLLGPTETDLEDIIRALRWIAHEMDERYKKFSTAVARHLDDYNRKAVRKGEDPLPRIVVLIDELADLMMSSPEETERTLTRIAQMARATGIHLVVATQRPSTDVVTGLIKANFPARVSFATASNTDSRVIIDTPGAESLLGRGDMLFLPPDATAPMRVQGCYISEQEWEAIIRHWQKIEGATPAQAPWTVMAKSAGPDALRIEGQPEDADLLDRAIALAKKRGKITTSGLQRRLRISYPRAARLMEEMESMGLVGPQQSAGRKRQVILGDQD